MEKLDLKSRDIKTHNMRKIWPYYKKHKTLLILNFIFLSCSGILAVASPIFSANALAKLAEGKFDEAIRFTILIYSTNSKEVLFS